MDNIIDNFIDRIYWNTNSDKSLYVASIGRNKSLQAGKDDLRPRNSTRTTKEIAAELEAKSLITKRRERLSGRLRYETLIKYNSQCLLCGASARDGVKVDVDHIKPVSKYPELINDPDNLQLLCRRCNSAKYNRAEDDFRQCD